MGLDMYLMRKTYIGANYEFNKITGAISIFRDGKPVNISFNRISEISERAAYWRKSNQIHNWFVKRVQNGVDDCGEYQVSRELLETLVDDCLNALSNRDKAADILPTASGFFFGSTEMDDYYFQDLEYTYKTIKELLDETNIEDYDVAFYYQSSW